MDNIYQQPYYEILIAHGHQVNLDGYSGRTDIDFPFNNIEVSLYIDGNINIKSGDVICLVINKYHKLNSTPIGYLAKCVCDMATISHNNYYRECILNLKSIEMSEYDLHNWDDVFNITKSETRSLKLNKILE